MIPTMIVVGVVLGRWWKTTLVLATIGWPVVLLVDGAIGLQLSDVLLAALLGFANALVGVGAHQAFLRAFRWGREAARSRRRRTTRERA